MLVKMTHIQMIGTRTQLDATIAALHRLGVLHIQDAPRSGALKSLALDEVGLRLQEDLAFLAARLDALIRLLPVPEDYLHGADSNTPPVARELADQVRGELDRIAPDVQELAQRRDELHAEPCRSHATRPRCENWPRSLSSYARSRDLIRSHF